MKLRSPLLIRLVAAFGSLLIRLWISTMRACAVSLDGRKHPTDPAREKFVFAFWHDGLLAPLVIRTPVRVLISEHADGELIAQVCQHLGIGVIRGSSHRGGMRALLEMIRTSGNPAHLGITPDGPRGPRRQLQAGIIMVASQTGIPIVPFGVGFSRVWRAPSWDRFAVPCPFSTMVGVIGEPIPIPANLTKEDLRRYQTEVQDKLNELSASAEAWGARIRHEGCRAAPPEGTAPYAVRRAA